MMIHTVVNNNEALPLWFAVPMAVVLTAVWITSVWLNNAHKGAK